MINFKRKPQAIRRKAYGHGKHPFLFNNIMYGQCLVENVKRNSQDVSRCDPSNNSKRSDGIWNEGSTTQSTRCGSRICVRGRPERDFADIIAVE